MICPGCHRPTELTGEIPDDDEFDLELAYECGLTEAEEADAIVDYEGKWSRFRYVQDLWICYRCQIAMLHTEGPRYWWNPDSGNYDGQKPLTPMEQARQKREELKAAGQLDMFESEADNG